MVLGAILLMLVHMGCIALNQKPAMAQPIEPRESSQRWGVCPHGKMHVSNVNITTLKVDGDFDWPVMRICIRGPASSFARYRKDGYKKVDILE